MDNKRNSPVLRSILHNDVQITKKLVTWMLKYLPGRSLKSHCKFLEISCHGIVWLSVWLAFTWLIDNENLYEMQINMLLGLILDITIIAVLKAIFRRRRPVKNNDVFSIGPDKFSFPSGHASRAFYVLIFFIYLYPVSTFLRGPMFAWAFSVVLSRLLLERHYLLDVIVGIMIGFVDNLILYVIWLNPHTTKAIMKFISNDLPGGVE